MNEKILDKLPEDLKNKLYEGVIRKLINLPNNVEIDELYNNQRNHFNDNESSQQSNIDILSDSFTEFKDKEIKVLGIDLPCWIDWSTSKPKLMIIGRDPQRNAQKQEGLIIGSPYSLVSKGGRIAKNNYWNFIKPLIEKHRVYITDIYKLFISNPIDKVNKLRGLPIHFEIFKEELQLIKPDTIITIGKDAADAIKKFIDEDKNFSKKSIYENLVYEVFEKKDGVNRKFLIYFIPHISGQVTSGIVTIANLYKSIGKLNEDKDLQFIGEEMIKLKDKLFKQ
jgi:uracil-DNA glycosylase